MPEIPNKLIIGLALPAVVLAIAIGGLIYYDSTKPQSPMACTEEAMICPDGSAVGRIGPNCEFAPCPGPYGTDPQPGDSSPPFTGDGQPGEPVACTMEAKLCPDGTAVGRSGPNCEFAPCPGEGGTEPVDPVVCTMDVKICPDGSYVGRIAPYCQFAPCPGN